MNITFISLIILTVARLWIAIQLFLTARRSKLTNLYWLAGVFALAIYSLFTPLPTVPLGNYWVFHLGFVAGHFCLAMFIHTTFYHGRKSPVPGFLGLIVFAFCIDIYALLVNDLNLAGIISAVGLINWIWHFVVARSAYSAIAADPGVENWVKTRYKLMTIYIVMMILGTTQVVVSSTNLVPFIPSAVSQIGILFILGGLVLQFLVWVMPESFRSWLNRQQQARSSQKEKESLFVLDVFGTAMTADTGLKSMICLYAIRTTISKRIGSEDSAVVQKYINTMTYQEWDTIIQHSELRRILINSGADDASAARAIQNARQALVEKQSLLTLGVH